jgi:hypothetical protein
LCEVIIFVERFRIHLNQANSHTSSGSSPAGAAKHTPTKPEMMDPVLNNQSNAFIFILSSAHTCRSRKLAAQTAGEWSMPLFSSIPHLPAELLENCSALSASETVVELPPGSRYKRFA